jgi:hypothetical protein
VIDVLVSVLRYDGNDVTPDKDFVIKLYFATVFVSGKPIIAVFGTIEVVLLNAMPNQPTPKYSNSTCIVRSIGCIR